ncbi:MAG TPA: hypothetical protein VL494_13390 [Steroidobacteraceae bacterium]|jgi:hypothetical protein|nr:hypothetical protein [Steroidobacteraceae bacterium]
MPKEKAPVIPHVASDLCACGYNKPSGVARCDACFRFFASLQTQGAKLLANPKTAEEVRALMVKLLMETKPEPAVEAGKEPT